MAGQFDGCLRLRLEEKTMRVMRVSFWRGAYYWQLRNMNRPAFDHGSSSCQSELFWVMQSHSVGRYSLNGCQCHPETPE